MRLAESARLCDSIELWALESGRTLSQQQIVRQFFPASKDSTDTNLVREAMRLAQRRKRACGGGSNYPFQIEARSIKADPVGTFNIYHFLLFGRTLSFGGPPNVDDLLRKFRRYFEDVVCWSLRRAGFIAEVLSEPREPRGLHVSLANSLHIVRNRFGELATLKADSLLPHDNDLDVDVLAVARPGNKECGGWPYVVIQCATGALMTLQSKISCGQHIFSSVWDGGFFPSHGVRGCATPDCLLTLNAIDWGRLSVHGWILDRTRLVHLASFGHEVLLPNDVNAFWLELSTTVVDIDWHTGWQSATQTSDQME